MNKINILEVKENVFKDNEVNAVTVRKELKEKNKLMINVMSSPGSGKTTTLARIISMLQPKIKIGVLECDIDASVDTQTIIEKGGKGIQLHTGGMCHMDAQMTKQGLDAMGIDDVDLVFIENVGNLVCPAEFDTGSNLNMMILSVPEGDDKPLKYPLMFEITSLVLINKTDVMPYFDFSLDRVKQNIAKRNPKSVVYPICSKQGEGLSLVADYIIKLVEDYKKGE